MSDAFGQAVGGEQAGRQRQPGRGIRQQVDAGRLHLLSAADSGIVINPHVYSK